MRVILNGQEREFAQLESPSMLSEVLEALELKADRVAVEHNGAIVSRSEWADAAVHSGDKLEVVHFVGGGCQ
jgi:thiamine biosynthesis protein ThiS